MISRDGRTAVVTDYGTGSAPTLTVIDVPGKRVARTISLGQYTAPHGIAFLPGDSLVIVTSERTNNVVIVAVAAGEIRKVIPTKHRGSHMVGVTADGRRLLYMRGATYSNLWRLDATGGSPVRQLTRGTIPLAFPDVSPDGKWIAATAGSEPDGDIVRIPIDGGEPVRLTEGVGAVWAPDGRRLAFVSKRNGSPGVWLMTPDGIRVEEVGEGGNKNHRAGPRKHACRRAVSIHRPAIIGPACGQSPNQAL